MVSITQEEKLVTVNRSTSSPNEHRYHLLQLKLTCTISILVTTLTGCSLLQPGTLPRPSEKPGMEALLILPHTLPAPGWD